MMKNPGKNLKRNYYNNQGLILNPMNKKLKKKKRKTPLKKKKN